MTNISITIQSNDNKHLQDHKGEFSSFPVVSN